MGSAGRAADAVCAVETDGVATWRISSARAIFATTSRILPKHNSDLGSRLAESREGCPPPWRKAETAREEERGMARQGKTRPARRENGTNDSLLIRSAESLGRMIGSLQRQLEAARHLTDRADGAEFRGNGHVPARQQSSGTAKTQRKTKSARSNADSKHAAADRKS